MNYQESINVQSVIRSLQNMGELEFSTPTFRTKFSYALARNSRILESHFKDLEVVREKDTKWKEYEERRLALCEKHAKKDKDNEAIKNSRGVFDGLEGNKKFSSEIADLRKQYSDNLHEGDVTMEFYHIKEAWLPVSANFIGAYADILFDLIEWEEKQETKN